MGKRFCVRLKEIRLEQGLTQKELGALVKISANKISQLERCLIPAKLDDLWDLSFALNVKIPYITGKDDIKELPNTKYEYDDEFYREFGYVTLD